MTPTKADLRAAYLARRQALTEAEWAARSLAVAEQVLGAYAFGPGDVAHIFLPMTARRELDTWPLIRGLWERQVQVGVPVSDFATKGMRTARLGAETVVALEKYGIPEPVDPVWLEDGRITHVFVPLLVVDRAGHRIGYGGGFYDRFLATLRQRVHKIGLSLEAPIRAIPELHGYDLPLDACVTPEGVVEF